MNLENYLELQPFLDSLPDPETPDEIAVCCYSDILDTISEALVDYRIQHHQTQKDLADLLGINQSMVSKYESGGCNPTIKTLCDVLSKIGKKALLSVEDYNTNTVSSDIHPMQDQCDDEGLFAA